VTGIDDRLSRGRNPSLANTAPSIGVASTNETDNPMVLAANQFIDRIGDIDMAEIVAIMAARADSTSYETRPEVKDFSVSMIEKQVALRDTSQHSPHGPTGQAVAFQGYL